MTDLANWLRSELARRGLTQNAASVYAGVGQATISDILNKGHVPRAETLFRLADLFGAPREQVLRLAGYLPAESADDAPTSVRDGYLVAELLELFGQVPDGWKPEALAHLRVLVRLASQPSVRIIGGDELQIGETQEQEDQEAGSQAA